MVLYMTMIHILLVGSLAAGEDRVAAACLQPLRKGVFRRFLKGRAF
jgi:hypothetical protein